MYALKRRQDICSIGYYKNDQPGFPSENSKFHWVSQCNFTFTIIGKVKTLQKQEFGLQDEYSGWMLLTTIQDQNSKKEQYLYVSNEVASSNQKLKKFFLKSLFGSVCRLKSEDFWRFVEQDMLGEKLKICYLSTKCGKISMHNQKDNHFWVFPEISLSSTGKKINQEEVFVNQNILMNGFKRNKITLPDIFPVPAPRDFINTQILKQLGVYLQQYYGPRLPVALLVISSAIKALHRDTLMKHENQVSIMNVSGDPNIGKSFACAIALQLLGAPNLMLSKCTASAILDHAHTFNNMLIVWDDPRDCPQSQMASIIHEAFHGHSVATISKGNRSYNSNIIIGTQKKLLGLQETIQNAPTFSRLSHADFNHIHTDFKPTQQHEQNLKQFIKKYNINAFGFFLQQTNVDFKEIDNIQNTLLKHIHSKNILQRSIRNLAIDWYFANQINKILKTECQLHEYFYKHQINYLNKFCTQINIIQLFFTHTKQLIQHQNIPQQFFKKVKIKFPEQGVQNCYAIFDQEFFPFLHKHITQSNIYDTHKIKHEIKNSIYGHINKNVAFIQHNQNKKTKIKRAIVIKTQFIDT